MNKPLIDKDACTECEDCVTACPLGIITSSDGAIKTVPDVTCIDCSLCVDICPANAVTLIDPSHQEFLTVPRAVLKGPAQIRVKAFLYSAGNRDEIMREFSLLADDLGLGSKNIIWKESSAFLIGVGANECNYYLTLTLSIEHYSVSLWTMGSEGDEIKFTDQGEFDNGYLESAGRTKLTDLNILVEVAPRSDEGIESFFGGRKPFASVFFEESAIVYSDYYPDKNKREQYLVTPVANADALNKVLPELIDNIEASENYYHLLTRPRSKIVKAISSIGRIESTVLGKISAITKNFKDAEADAMKLWLQELAFIYSQISTLNYEFREHGLSSKTNKAILEDLMQERQEQKYGAYVSLSVPLVKNINSISSENSRFFEQIKELRDEVGDVIAMLRTRTNVVLQEQSLALQKDSYKTTRSQLKLQKSIEGLYVFIVAYYLTALFKIMLEALSTSVELPFSVIQGAAAFVPFALLIGYYLSGKMTERLTGKKKRQGRKKHSR